MFIIYVLSMITGALIHFDLLSGVLVLFLNGVIAYQKGTMRHFFMSLFVVMIVYFQYAVLLPTNTLYNNDQFGFLSSTHKNKVHTLKQQSIRFNDDIYINGDQLKGTIVFQNKNYQVFHVIEQESTFKQLKSNLPFMKTCIADLTLLDVMPNTNEDGFDYSKYLQIQNVSGVFKLSHIKFEQCHFNHLNGIEHILLFRSQIIETIFQMPFKYSSFFIALALGETKYLSTEALNNLKVLGIYHLYAVSGSHVSLISIYLYALLKRSYIPIILAKIFILILLPIFILLTGSAPSVLRAAIFIMIVLLFEQKYFNLLSCLSLSFIINYIIEPTILLDIGFQLSYSICFMFILLLTRLKNLHPVFLLFISTFVSQLITVPIVLCHFHSVYFIGMISNLLFVPLFSVIIFPMTMIILFVLLIFHNIPTFVLTCYDKIFELNILLTKAFLNIPKFEWIVGRLPIWLYVLSVIFLMLLFNKAMRNMSIVALIMIVIIIEIRPLKEQIHFLDVNQGDSMIIQDQHQVVLIDTGGKLKFNTTIHEKHKNASIASQITMPFLKAQQIRTIDYLIITHPDIDHFGEATYILEHFNVKHLIIKLHSKHVKKYTTLIQTAHKTSTQIIDVNQLEGLKLTHMTLSFLNTKHQADDENDESIIIELKHVLHKNFLLMGDLSDKAEKTILNQLKSQYEGIKVGHHGSKNSTSNDLLNTINAKYAIISAGRNNPFKHPHQETIDKLSSFHIGIFDTRIHGRITYDFYRGWYTRWEEYKKNEKKKLEICLKFYLPATKSKI